MTIPKRPKLPLTNEERQKLRKNKIKLNELHQFEIAVLSDVLSISEERATMLKGLATFQQIPSIGYEIANKIVQHLGFHSLSQLKDEQWAKTFDRLEEKLGYWIDPCVEDQIICIIHHANHPNSDKQWFHFTKERKEYREKYGYPSTRPKVAWYDIS